MKKIIVIVVFLFLGCKADSINKRPQADTADGVQVEDVVSAEQPADVFVGEDDGYVDPNSLWVLHGPLPDGYWSDR